METIGKVKYTKIEIIVFRISITGGCASLIRIMIRDVVRMNGDWGRIWFRVEVASSGWSGRSDRGIDFSLVSIALESMA